MKGKNKKPLHIWQCTQNKCEKSPPTENNSTYTNNITAAQKKKQIQMRDADIRGGGTGSGETTTRRNTPGHHITPSKPHHLLPRRKQWQSNQCGKYDAYSMQNAIRHASAHAKHNNKTHINGLNGQKKRNTRL